MFTKREIIYKKDNYDRRQGTFKSRINGKVLFFYIVILLYIINYCNAPTLQTALQIHTAQNTSIAGVKDYNKCNNKKEELMNPAYLIKHPFPFRYLPENNSPYYYFDTTFKVKKFLFTEGMRNDYDMYIAGNCFGESCHAEFTANCTAKLVEGLHFLIERFEFKKIEEFDDIIFQSIDDMIKQVGLIIDTGQLDLFPEIKPVYREKIGVIEYRKTIFK